MTPERTEVSNKIYSFVKKYLEIDVDGIKVNCPYWMNKIRDRRIIRGFADGKGTASAIRSQLVGKLSETYGRQKAKLSPELLQKLAKRERIGIDCSGFVFRVVDYCLREKLFPSKHTCLIDVFPEGITRTNADKLTGSQKTYVINLISEIKPGDLIRMREGRHIAIIVKKTSKKIVYAHSSSYFTQIHGVHLGEIIILDSRKSLEYQRWTEKTKNGLDFQKIYFDPARGDGICRLKIS